MRLPLPSSEPAEPPARLPLGSRLLALAAGIIFAVLGLKSALEDYRIHHKLSHFETAYRPISAKLLKVKVRRDTSGNEAQYYPDILYEYEVEGRSVWGWRFSYEEEPRSRAYWESRLLPYREGETVTAYVHHRNPKDAVVEQKHDGDLYRLGLKIAVGAGFFLLGLALFAIPAYGFAGAFLRRRRLQ